MVNTHVDEKAKPKTKPERVLQTKEIPRKKQTRYTGTRRGYFRPLNKDKYDGNSSNIIYRSKIELRLMKYLDSQPSVEKWSSEETIIPYVSPLDNKVHRYFVDMKATVKQKDGTSKTYLIEVKWSTATVPPKVPKKKTRRYFSEVKNWTVNQAKWEAAKTLCEKKGWTWMVLTEKQLDF